MNTEKITQKVKLTIDYLKSFEGTRIKQFIDLKPQNDFEYLKSWFYY